MKIGVIISIPQITQSGMHAMEENMELEFQKIIDLGIGACQLNCWESFMLNKDIADIIVRTREKTGIEITSFWCGWEGPKVWNFYEGPLTLGLVPQTFRYDRFNMLKRGSDFAKMIEVENIITHVGFIPEDPNDEDYRSLIPILKDLAQYCKNNDQYFMFETGQETPSTLLRTIEDIGMDNLGINLDPANLIMYGKANPVDALDVIGKYVRDVHAKDAVYPTSGRNLGNEVILGEGKVDFPRLIQGLKDLGYGGSLTIEREISGEQQVKDILHAKQLLEKLI